MTFPTFGRLARLYQSRLYRLYSGRLWEMVQNPVLSDDPAFQRAAWQVARGMVAEVSKANATSWRAAAHKSMRSREIYQALRAEEVGLSPELDRITDRNAALIRSVPREVAARITSRATELQREGARPAELECELRRIAKHLADSRIRLISRTEISKAETGLTKVRAQDIGVDWGVWQTSEDQRVRASHRNLNGVLMMWTDPPQPEDLIGQQSTLGAGLAGEFPNCRCVMLPLVSMDEVRWPARVLRGGRIVRMNRAEFSAIGMRIAA